MAGPRDLGLGRVGKYLNGCAGAMEKIKVMDDRNGIIRNASIIQAGNGDPRPNHAESETTKRTPSWGVFPTQAEISDGL